MDWFINVIFFGMAAPFSDAEVTFNIIVWASVLVAIVIISPIAFVMKFLRKKD